MLIPRSRVVAEAIGRAIDPLPLLVMTGLGIAAVTAVIMRAGPVSPGAMMQALRWCALFLAIAISAAFDDESAATIASVPVPLGVRRAIAVAWHAALIGAAWLALCGVAQITADGIPVGALSVELIGFCSIALGLAGAITATGRTSALPLAAPSLLVARQFSLLLPARWDIWGAVPGTPQWTEAHLRMLALAVIAVAVTLFLSRDPAMRIRGR